MAVTDSHWSSRSMQQILRSDLANRLRLCLRAPLVQPWFLGLTTGLVDIGWSSLNVELGLSRESYSTARMIRGDLRGPRTIIATVSTPRIDVVACTGIPIELLPEEIARQFNSGQWRFRIRAEVLEPQLMGCIDEAVAILGIVPGILPAIVSLIGALHILDSQDDEMDISFSEPRLPFSAFVSVPGPRGVYGALRVAEAVLHEAMHLQLSLVERVVPLVTGSTIEYFSPWRNESRPPQGLLHGAYVFGAIDAFLRSLPLNSPLIAPYYDHVHRRRKTIAEEMEGIRCFLECEDLTADGVALVSRILGSFMATESF